MPILIKFFNILIKFLTFKVYHIFFLCLYYKMSRRINARTKRNVAVKRRNTKRRNTMRKVAKRNRNVNRKNYRNYGGTSMKKVNALNRIKAARVEREAGDGEVQKLKSGFASMGINHLKEVKDALIEMITKKEKKNMQANYANYAAADAGGDDELL